MSKQRYEKIWDEAYTVGLCRGKQAGLDIAQKQMEKVFKEAYHILKVELHLTKEATVEAMKSENCRELHDPYRGDNYVGTE